jgi:hypothetical protein
MADISITAANVQLGSGSRIDRSCTAGAALTAGQWVYKDGSTYKLADDNSATAAVRVPVGVALNGASTGQPVAVQTAGEVTIGGTLTPGVAYYLSDTPGGMCPVADLAAGEYPCIVGIAKSATVLKIGIVASGVAL